MNDRARSLGSLVLFVVALLCRPVPSHAGAAAPQEDQFLANVRQLTFEGRRSGEGYFSPDGRALLFQSERDPANPFYQIFLLNLETGDATRVSPGLGKTTCSFFRPGADEILFASTHLDPEAAKKQRAELEFRAAGKQRRYSWDYDEQMDIFSARRDGTGLTRLTRAAGYDAEAAYSPDGRNIVFCSLRDAYPAEKLSAADRQRLETDPAYFGEIYLMNADGSDQRRLTFSPGYDGGPFFSPDGQRIIWRHFDEKGTTADVYTMRLDGSDQRRLTDFHAMSWAPFFHPSGRYVIFTANKLGFSNFELYLVDAAGTREPVRVTFTDGFDGLPAFSPDGQRLCWTSTRGSEGQSQLFLADWKHDAALAALAGAPARSQSQAAPVEPVAPAATAAVPDISAAQLRRDVDYLASDALEGRMTGSKGSAAAAKYIGQRLQSAGVRTVGSAETFFHEFQFTAGGHLQTNENRFELATAGHEIKKFEVEKDFRPLSFTANQSVSGEVVFAGYGLVVPGKAAEAYNSYAGLDVSNKVVLALRYVPEQVESKRRQELNRYSELRYKAMMARERGAKAVLVVTGPNSPNAGALARLSFDSSFSGSGIVAASITTNLAEQILAASGKTLGQLQTELDSENPHAQGGFVIPKTRVTIATAIERVRKTDHNVIGVIPAATETTNQPEYVMLGAHFDHLGFGETGSRENKEEIGQIHNGADDNASGVAAALELAANLAAERQRHPEAFQRGVILGFWSGEELGLIGSAAFVEHPPVTLTQIVAYLNFDMVGRLRDNKLILQGVGSSPVWRRMIEKRNVSAGFNLVLQDDPYQPTDVTSFYPKGIPVLSFFTGSHDDYHRPTDDADKLDYPGLERITRFARSVALDLARTKDRVEFAKVERQGTGGNRDNLRVYLGTIPDYASEVPGVKLSGVSPAGPADQAGLKGGDVIVEFAGQRIANIYDYTYALDAAKIAQPVKIVVLRDGSRREFTVVPAARK